MEGIDSCCCVYDEHHIKIVLFFTGKIEEKEIGQQLRKLIPEYMMPNRKIRLETMPLNLNGKIDRVKLKAGLSSDFSVMG